MNPPRLCLISCCEKRNAELLYQVPAVPAVYPPKFLTKKEEKEEDNDV